ncbi:chymotrypsin-1-like isoform X2 [Zophobas morio]|uniref:chymotrypsin-1-like isoform X2 n=1 Tax=Zophobas morio TaxID=2755281 RepID=UPI0030831E78
MLYEVITILLLINLVSGSSLNPRIVNGVNTYQNEFPQIVSLRYNNKHTCGATILNENFLLTAAHCVQLNVINYNVQYGLTHIIEGPNAPNVIGVSRLIPHENYLPVVILMGARNDVALVELKESLKFGTNVQPTKLPKASSTVPESSTAVVAGWGLLSTGGLAASDLQKVYLEVYSDTKCETSMFSASKWYHICAGVPQGSKGICNGDSGGPLIVDGTQVGIVSWSTRKCGLEGVPGVFVKVSNYVGWIEKNMSTDATKSNGFFANLWNYVHHLFFK